MNGFWHPGSQSSSRSSSVDSARWGRFGISLNGNTPHTRSAAISSMNNSIRWYSKRSRAQAQLIELSRLSSIDSERVKRLWTKALERRVSDPDGAITAARTLLESVCKHILDDRGVTRVHSEVSTDSQ